MPEQIGIRAPDQHDGGARDLRAAAPAPVTVGAVPLGAVSTPPGIDVTSSGTRFSAGTGARSRIRRAADPATTANEPLPGGRVRRVPRSPALPDVPTASPAGRVRRSTTPPLIRRSPTRKNAKDLASPLYYESKHPEIELLKVGDNEFRIKGTMQTLVWKPPKYYRKGSGRAPSDEFDMDAFAASPQFEDFSTTTKEVVKATSVPGDDDVARALKLHVLQRFIANAVYSADEISKVHYQSSPLNFHESGSYIRSHATAFVEALKKRLGADADVHLVRSLDFNQVLGEFLTRFDASVMAPDIARKVDEIAKHALDNPNDLSKLGDRAGLMFADISASLVPKALPTLRTEVDDAARRINKYVFEQTRLVAIRKWAARTYSTIEVGQRDTIVAELESYAAKTRTDLPAFHAHLQSLFDAKKLSDVNDSSDVGKDKEALFTGFKDDLGPYRAWIIEQERGRPLTTAEAAFKTAKADSRDRFKDLLKTDSFRDYLRSKTHGGPTADKAAVKELVTLIGKLETALPNIVMVGGTVKVSEQPALMLKTGTVKQLTGMVDFALNKGGYVPTPTATSRKLLETGTLVEIVKEIAERQRATSKDDAVREKIATFVEQIDKFKPEQYRSRIDAVGQLAKTKHAFDMFTGFLSGTADHIRLQAESTAELIKGLGMLDETSPLPPLALQELQVNLQDALTNKNDLAAFIRNIQNIHELVILKLELDPVGASAKLKDAIKVPEGAKSPHVTDYGLRAFSQAYQAVVKQNTKDTLAIDAYSSIYFELTQKLQQASEGGGSKVTVRQPENLASYKKLRGDTALGVAVDASRPDLVLIDIHPNDASKATMAQQSVSEMIDELFVGAPPEHRMTVIVDITLNHVRDPAVGMIRDAAKKHIDSGQLNLVFIQSLTKFAEMGSDKQSGGLMFHFNDDKNWTAFNKSITESADLDRADPTAENYFRALLKYCEKQQVQYIDKIRANTKYVYAQLQEQFTKLGADPKTIELSVSTDPGACYVAFNYRELTARLFGADKDNFDKTEQLSKRILNDAIYTMVNKLDLPLSMRQSFGFPISNLGEAWIGSRFTIGTEDHGMLDDYIRIITYVKAKIAGMSDTVLKDDAQRRLAFAKLSDDVKDLNDLKVKLDAILDSKKVI